MPKADVSNKHGAKKKQAKREDHIPPNEWSGFSARPSPQAAAGGCPEAADQASSRHATVQALEGRVSHL